MTYELKIDWCRFHYLICYRLHREHCLNLMDTGEGSQSKDHRVAIRIPRIAISSNALDGVYWKCKEGGGVRLLYGIISLESTDRPAHHLLFCSYKEKSERTVAVTGD